MVAKGCENPVALGLGTGQRFSYHSREVEEMQKVRKSIFFVKSMITIFTFISLNMTSYNV